MGRRSGNIRLKTDNPFIIAEVGSNFESFDDCIESIKTAYICGASAVKFQMFNSADLYGYDANPDLQCLPKEWLGKLSLCAIDLGIDFMCTAFSPEGIKIVDPYVKVHKIASSDITDPKMLQAVKATGKPVILSTGAAEWLDIFYALHGNNRGWSGFGPTADVVLLYCNSAYPSKRHNLFAMDELKSFGPPVGFSDHSTDVIYAPVSAVRHFGAVVIEKHFKLREMCTPDAGHSLLPEEFKVMCDRIRSPDIGGHNPEEDHMRHTNQRRLVVTKDLEPGTILKYGVNFGGYRSTQPTASPVSPMFWEDFDGGTISIRMPAGTALLRSDIH